jgi:methylated-DNA-[protein]-cysteine S-methyltransferase
VSPRARCPVTEPEAPLACGHISTWAGETRMAASAVGIRCVHLPEWTGATRPLRHPARVPVVDPSADADAEAHLRQGLTELAEYLDGARRSFTVALDLRGPRFFQTVWAAVADIPYGETRTYGELARALGVPHGPRAVGAANAANPVAPLVPCHRLVGSDGRLTGYGPGLPLKLRLLRLEEALPASAADYPAWTARVTARLGPDWVLGVRGDRTYCAPGCNRSQRHPELPARLLPGAGAAEREGFRPCPRCGGVAR